MLIIDAIPRHFFLRYGYIPERFYIRKCYEELYDYVTKIMLTETIVRPAVLFTGVPGIGKSIFMIYFLCRHQDDDRFPDKRFAFEADSGSYFFYEPIIGTKDYVYSNDNSFTVADVLVVADISQLEEPKHRGKWTLIFSPPDPSRYKYFMKVPPAITLLVPTWTEEEFLLVDPNIEKWYERFVKCGGIAKIVLWKSYGDDPMRVINTALLDKDSIVADFFFKNGFGNVDPNVSYSLIYNNPPSSEEGVVLYHSEMMTAGHTFASDHVFRHIQENFKKYFNAQAKNLFDAGNVSGLASQTLENLFEKICLWLVPLAGKTITPTSLLDYQNHVGDIVLPQKMNYLAYNWKKLRNLECSILYQPMISNLESGDAFCLIQKDNIFILIVFQITVGTKHPIKANGLKHIVRAFPENISALISRKLIIFVTPMDGKLNTAQPIHSKNNAVLEPQNTPNEAKNFEQWVYHYEINK
jgi:hypothetical protein